MFLIVSFDEKLLISKRAYSRALSWLQGQFTVLQAATGVVNAPMLHINDLTYRIEGRLLIDKATTAIPAGHKVGPGGTKWRWQIHAAAFADRSNCTLRTARSACRAMPAWACWRKKPPMAKKACWIRCLVADEERASLLAEAETATDPNRISGNSSAPLPILTPIPPLPAPRHSGRPWL